MSITFQHEKYIDLAIKTFDEAEKIAEATTVAAVGDMTNRLLMGLRDGVIEFANTNQAAIRKLHEEMHSEMGIKRNYRMQSTKFADESFREYISKVMAIPDAVHSNNISAAAKLDADYFKRDRDFNIALFSTEENDVVDIPAAEAFNELRYMNELVTTIDWCMEIVKGKANLFPVLPEKEGEQMVVGLKSVKLLATSMVRYCALLFRHVVNNASELFKHAISTEKNPLVANSTVPSIFWNPKKDCCDDCESDAQRWKVFI